MSATPRARESLRRRRRLLRFLGLLIRAAVMLAVDAAVLVVVTALLSSGDTLSFGAAALVAVAMAVINAVLWPIVTRLALPLTIITFGLGSLVLSAGTVALAFYWVEGRAPSFWADLVTAVALAVVSMIVAPLLDVDGDPLHLRVVRRRVSAGGRAQPSDVPGVIMFEIDGLGEGVLRRALEEGFAPTMARWLEEGSHRVQGWECDLSSQTGASQAGLLLGSNWDMPAFRWYEKETGRTMVSNHPADAAEIEQRHIVPGALLAEEGTSRGNMFSGGAPRCTATMSMIRDRSRSKARDLFAYFSDPYGFIRTLVLSLADIAGERRAARAQRRSGAPHVERGGAYPLIRTAITVVMRDLITALLVADIVEGVPVSYGTFVGYDEVAHHSGIAAPDALAVLRRHDRQLERLEHATAESPRPYHLVVLSDHGQTQGAPFRQRYGETLEEVVLRALARGGVYAPASVDEAWGDVGAVLADASQDASMPGRALARATRSRSVEGTVALGPNRQALEQRRTGAEGKDGEQVVVLASGCLGLVYLPFGSGRLTAEQISESHPELLGTLASHPGIGFVMVRSAARGAIVLGAEGSRRLEDDVVEGVDPLADFYPTAADHLRRHDSFPHCPDILVNSMYDRQTDEVAPFEEFMGSHGGLGGPQTRPFAVVPAEWRIPEEPIVGAEAMHRTLNEWIAEAAGRSRTGD